MFKSLLNFDEMITPKIIIIIYWLGIIAVVISGVSVIFATGYYGSFFSGLLSGLATIFLVS
ncbi:DUF4282 domain-containing protein [Xenorhabdus bharatensis]|uniref:DUF4282 domain-containing protein n=1 Tax=Xenorhabdus bharatensis TaxID=3136256 RepID=UPI0030F4826C